MDLQQLSDLYEIQKLKARYFRYLDTKQWDDFRDLFTEEVEWTSGGPQSTSAHLPFTDFEGMISYLRSAKPGKVTTHHGHMPEIEFVDANTATGIWAMFDWVDDPGRGAAWQGYGHYHETYIRCADGRWRISAMRLTRLRLDHIAPSQGPVE